MHISQFDRSRMRLLVAGRWIIQLHHVPNDLLFGQRGPGSAGGRGVGDHLRRHRGRRNRTPDHRPHRGLDRLEDGTHRPGDLLRRDSELWHLCAPAETMKHHRAVHEYCALAALLVAECAVAATYTGTATPEGYPDPPQVLFQDLFVAVQ